MAKDLLSEMMLQDYRIGVKTMNSETKKYTYEDTMPNFFAVKNDAVDYKFNNAVYRMFVIKNGQRNQSVTITIESGINHWLDYWWHTDETVYNKICQSLCDTYFYIHNAIYLTKYNNKSVYKARGQIIDKFCFPPKVITDSFIHYIVDLTTCNCIKEEATTEITVTNSMATAFAIYAYYFKYLEIFSEMNPDRWQKVDKDDDREWTLVSEKLIDQCCRDIANFRSDNPEIEAKMKEIFEIDDLNEIDPIAVKDGIYNFIADRAGIILSKSSTYGFSSKYSEVGYDENWNERTCISAAFKACKKFSAPLKDDALIPKYASDVHYRDLKTKKIKASDIHYVLGFDYSDFRFVTKQVAGYVQSCLKNTNTTIITKQTVDNINVNNIMYTDSEAARKQEMAIIEDDAASLYDMRIEYSLKLFRNIMGELRDVNRKTNIPDIFKFATGFDLSKSHRLNSYILAKIFLSINGERDIYRDIYGVYAKLFLALFYIRVMTDNKYTQYRSIAECMYMAPSVITGDAHKESIDEFLESHELNADLSVAFQNICRGYYNSERGTVGSIDIEQFYEFFKFMSNPYNVRHIINPTLYTNVKQEEVKMSNPNKGVVEECLKHIS